MRAVFSGKEKRMKDLSHYEGTCRLEQSYTVVEVPQKLSTCLAAKKIRVEQVFREGRMRLGFSSC